MQLESNTTYTVPEGYTVRITLEKLDPIAKGYNPQNLTVAQVGEGYRLLEKDETLLNPYSGHTAQSLRKETEAFGWSGDVKWSAAFYPNLLNFGYRVPLSLLRPLQTRRWPQYQQSQRRRC